MKTTIFIVSIFMLLVTIFIPETLFADRDSYLGVQTGLLWITAILIFTNHCQIMFKLKESTNWIKGENVIEYWKFKIAGSILTFLVWFIIFAVLVINGLAKDIEIINLLRNAVATTVIFGCFSFELLVLIVPLYDDNEN